MLRMELQTLMAQLLGLLWMLHTFKESKVKITTMKICIIKWFMFYRSTQEAKEGSQHSLNTTSILRQGCNMPWLTDQRWILVIIGLTLQHHSRHKILIKNNLRLRTRWCSIIRQIWKLVVGISLIIRSKKQIIFFFMLLI